MKKFLSYSMIFVNTCVFSQVGINTTDPKAQLEIKSSSETAPTITDGLLIPKVNNFPATNPTIDQQGMLVYLKNVSGTNQPGFYYWDFATLVWKPIAGATASGTLDQAYDSGGAGLGKTITADAGAVLIDGTDGLVSTGTLGSGAIAPSGAGVKMFWNPRKVAFRAGRVTGTQWNDANVGIGSTAFGESTIASGQHSFAFGERAEAEGYSSTSFGFQNLASGFASTAFGSGNTASGSQSTAFGNGTDAFGIFSTAFGQSNTAIGLASTAFGQNNNASSYAETAIGIGATTYTPSTNGATQFRTANATDRLFVIGNAIDSNHNGWVDVAERSDALIILKNGLTRLPSTTNAMITAADGKAVVTKEYLQSNSSAWGLTGNAGTSDATNFIGTTDDVDVIFRRNNINAGLIGTTNTSFGLNALISTTMIPDLIGDRNTAFGFSALQLNTQGLYNTAAGYQSLYSNTMGDYNSANGESALRDNSIGNRNTANGCRALLKNTTGNHSTAAGQIALLNNTTGGGNTAVGSNSLYINTTGSRNTSLGFSSDVALPNLDNATAIGARALVGASNSLVLGSINGVNGATASVNVGIGTTTPLDRLHVVGNIRMVDGNQAAGKVLTSNIDGTATWQNATDNAWGLTGNTGTGTANFIGTTDNQNFNIRTNNITRARILSTGEVGIGTTTPDRKLEVSGTGDQFARITTTGTANVGMDFKRVGSDWQIRNDAGLLLIGQSGDDLATVTDIIRVGGGSFTPATDNSTVLGQSTRRWTAVHAINGVIQTSDANDKKQMLPLRQGLDKIKSLRPISFQWKDDTIDKSSTHLGFVAQEVQQVLPEIVVDHEWKEIPDTTEKVWEKTERLGMKYAEIIPVLVKAMQEQQVIIEEQKEENNLLKNQLETQSKTIAEILERLKKLESK